LKKRIYFQVAGRGQHLRPGVFSVIGVSEILGGTKTTPNGLFIRAGDEDSQDTKTLIEGPGNEPRPFCERFSKSFSGGLDKSIEVPSTKGFGTSNFLSII
jgi:hypothetical protein